MNFCECVANKLWKLYGEGKITWYGLEKASGCLHSTIMRIKDYSNKDITLETLSKICHGLGVTLIEFLDDDDFRKCFEEVKYR